MIVPPLLAAEEVNITGWEYAGIQAGIFLAGMLALLGAVFLVSLLFAPYRQRNEARALLERELTPIPLQDRAKLIGTIVDVTTTAIELIKRKRKLLGGLKPSDKKAKLIVSEINDAEVEYNKALVAVNREKQIAGEPYETPIDSFLIPITLGVAFWYSTTPSGSDYLLTFKSMLKRSKAEIIKRIEKLNQQASRKEGSQT